MCPMSDLANDEIFIERTPDARSGPFKAVVGKNITIFDGSLDVTEGDVVIRLLPNGKEERRLVTEANFNQKFGSIPAHYVLEVSKEGSMKKENATTTTNNFNFHNSQGIQIGDYNTQNLQVALNEVLTKLNESGASHKDIEEAKGRLAKFLEHPLVSSVVGASLPVALGLLS